MNRLAGTLSPALRRPRTTWLCLPAQRASALRAFSTHSPSPSQPPSSPLLESAQAQSPTSPTSTTNAASPTTTASTSTYSDKTSLAGIPSDGYYPDLMRPDALLDGQDSADFPPTKRAPFSNRVVVRNDPSLFTELDDNPFPSYDPTDPRGTSSPDVPPDPSDLLMERNAVEEDTVNNVVQMAGDSPFTAKEMGKLHVYPLINRRVTQQTGKGKIHSMYALVVVGNGNGLVGYGEAKDDEAPVARDKALAKALRSLDYVDRFEKRTLWTDIESKFGGTKIILRSRPVGFGLRCNPNVHQVLKAAGIKDASAKVWGSRNPLMVVKTLFRMLQAGNAPLGMGDGIGGGARRLDKGSGLRNKAAVERERGRKLVDLRTF
ncbi:hypothetical protein PAXRUDRAFT_830815 [Paxillus rubicundulus Ve08.2h10]|uniref:Small ribosomal subunit protein uS5m n=1 Tax=Paxillus rubicundulus Ve08.2h10 TaxID=930991 RepID=A0A0D0DSZ5_9AGAM|nr:hypothetical protein PAXRUDRAFT_830815 [Paxillus rubicundulus Ve08.2h10]